MTSKMRPALLILAFSATVAAAITGLSFSAETKEVNLAETCALAAWPLIPAECLDGGTGYEVRQISADAPAQVDLQEMTLRFTDAFGAAS